jgi:hypothetical protein
MNELDGLAKNIVVAADLALAGYGGFGMIETGISILSNLAKDPVKLPPDVIGFLFATLIAVGGLRIAGKDNRKPE